jgi:hypothetical protein
MQSILVDIERLGVLLTQLILVDIERFGVLRSIIAALRWLRALNSASRVMVLVLFSP